MKTIYKNGAVYTGKLPLVEAFAVEDGKFVFAGSSAEADALAAAGDKVVDLGGKFVCSGFNDSHMHLLNYGSSLLKAQLAAHTESLEDMLACLDTFQKEHPRKDGAWLMGRGWNQDYFTDVDRMPNRYDLDRVSTEVPICATRACGHCLVVNSKALELLGVTADTPQPEGGEIGMENGEPDGRFFDNAMEPVYDSIPVPSKEEIKDMIRSACKALNSYGVTSSQSDDYCVYRAVPWQTVNEAYKELERADSGSEVTAAYTMTESQITDQAPTAVSVLDVPEFSGEPYVVLNGNEPDFTDEEKTTESYEHYSDPDSLGRCGVAEANIGQDLMPTEKRGAIGQVKPTGWHTVKYDQVEGKYLYNRCHLIGYQLTGENANEKNLITGTRYLNVEGMLPFENMVADYVKETGNHVLYRVTPIFTGDDLVADGVEMEALSMEDDGEGISFHIFAYNNQPGISINYATGDSTLSESSGTMTDQQEYVMNTSSMKFHLPSCSSVSSIKDENKATYQGPREDLIAEGYEPCGRCNP